MLVLKRKEGQWLTFKHKASGDVIRIRIYDIRHGHPSQVTVACEDDPRHFDINRPEREAAKTQTPAVPA